MMADNSKTNYAGDFPSYAGPSDNFIRAKLRESKCKVGKLVLFNMFVCPLLFTIVLLSLWGDLKYERFSFPVDICNLLNDVGGHILVSFLMLWALSHALELLLLFAIATDNIRFCRTYITAVAPLLWSFIILTFNVVVWSGLKPMDNNNLIQFIILSSSCTILVANVFSYHFQVLAEHLNFVSIVTLIDQCKTSTEYI